MVPLKKYLSVEKLIDIITEDPSRGDEFCVYAQPGTEEWVLEGKYWVDGFPTVDDEYNETFPPEVIDKDLEYFFSGQHLADVVENVRHQKPRAVLGEYIDALNYYNDHDTFMEL